MCKCVRATFSKNTATLPLRVNAASEYAASPAYTTVLAGLGVRRLWRCVCVCVCVCVRVCVCGCGCVVLLSFLPLLLLHVVVLGVVRVCVCVRVRLCVSNATPAFADIHIHANH